MKQSKSIKRLKQGILTAAFVLSPVAVADLMPSFSNHAEQYISQLRHHAFSLSPSGNKTAHIEMENAAATLVVTDQYANVTRINTGNTPIETLHWLNETTLAFSSGGQLRALADDGSHYRILIDNLHYREKGKSHRFASYKHQFRHWQVINPLLDEPNHILVGAKDREHNAYVHQYNLDTGELTPMADGKKLDINEWVVAANGRIGFGVKTHKQQQSFLASADSGWDKFNQQENIEELGMAFYGGSFLKRRSVFLGLANEENVAYFSENLQSDRFQVVEYDLETNSVTRVLAKDQRYDVGGDQHTHIVFDRYDGSLAGVHYHANKPKTAWIDPELASLQQRLDEQYPNEVHRIKQWSDDKGQLLIESYDSAARITVYAVNAQRLTRLKIAHLNTEADDLAAMQFVQFEARDGYTLDAYLTLPNNSVGPVPLVVMPHGGPWSRDTWQYSEEAQYFASQGFALLSVNFRGSTGRGLEHISNSIGELAGLMIDDIADGTRWAIRQGIAKHDSIYMLGTSYGGYAALMSAVRYPDLYQAVSANAAPLDLLKQFQHYKQNDHDFAYNFWRDAVADPKKDKALLEAISPINHLSSINTPYKIFHGDADAIVPVSHAKAAKKHMQHKNNLHIVPGEGHGFQSRQNRLFFLQQSLALFNQA